MSLLRSLLINLFVRSVAIHGFEAAAFEDAGVAEVFDHRPFTAYGRAERIASALARFAQIAASHHKYLMAFAFKSAIETAVKAENLSVPEIKELSKQSFGYGQQDVMAASSTLFAGANLLEGRSYEKACDALGEKVQHDQRQKKEADRPADPARNPLLWDAAYWFRGLRILFSCTQ